VPRVGLGATISCCFGMGPGSFPALAPVLEEYRTLAKTCKWELLLAPSDCAILAATMESSKAWALFLTEEPEKMDENAFAVKDEPMVDVGGANHVSNAQAGDLTAENQASSRLAAFVRRTLSALAVDQIFLSDDTDALSPFSSVDDVRYEMDPGMLDGSDAGSMQSSSIDPMGVYLLLDSEGASSVGMPDSFSGMRKSSSPLLQQYSSLKRPRRKSSGHEFGFALTDHIGDFVREMRNLCDIVREQHCSTPSNVAKSGGKPSKSTSRREAASAANVIEALEGFESQARSGRYERVDDCIKQVASCIANQETTFAEILPVLHKKANSLRSKEQAMLSQIRKLEELRSISVGVLASGGCFVRPVISRNSWQHIDNMDLDAVVPGGGCRAGIAGQSEGGADPRPHNSIGERSDSLDPKIEKTIESVQCSNSPGSISREGFERDKDACGPSSPCQPKQSPDLVPLYLNANSWLAKDAQNYLRRASNAAACQTLREVECIWQAQLQSADDRDIDQLVPAHQFPELRPLDSTSLTDISCNMFDGLSKSRKACSQCFSRTAEDELLCSPETGDSKEVHATNDWTSPISQNVCAIERIRELRQQLFALFDQKNAPPVGPSVPQGPRTDSAEAICSIVSAKATNRNVTSSHEEGNAGSDVFHDDEFIVLNEPRDICKQIASPMCFGGREMPAGLRQRMAARSVTSLLLAHGGFVESTESAIDIITDLWGEFVERIGRALASSREPRIPLRPGMASSTQITLSERHDSTGSRRKPNNISDPGYDIIQCSRTREETLEIFRLISASGFRGGYPELQNYIQLLIPRTAWEIADAEQKVRLKISEFTALSGTHFADVLSTDRGSTAPVSMVGPKVPDNSAAIDDEKCDVDLTLPLDERARVFGILNSTVRLDILGGIYLPRSLAERVLVKGSDRNKLPVAHLKNCA
jgi:hypothetical protein